MSASQQPRVYVDEARAELVSVALDRFRGPLRVISADVMAAAVNGQLGRAESALDELEALARDTRAKLRGALGSAPETAVATQQGDSVTPIGGAA